MTKERQQMGDGSNQEKKLNSELKCVYCHAVQGMAINYVGRINKMTNKPFPGDPKKDFLCYHCKLVIQGNQSSVKAPVNKVHKPAKPFDFNIIQINRRFIFIAIALVIVGICTYAFNSSEVSPSLPQHILADNSSLAPKDGRRIQINSYNPNLTKDDCIKLIAAYRKKAEPGGQVSVHKPSKILQGSMTPWCVENFDGRGIIFDDRAF